MSRASSIIDMPVVIEYNRQHAWRWVDRFNQVAQVLREETDWGWRYFRESSPEEDDFALAVAEWQHKKGLQADGKLGINTWKKLEHHGVVNSSGCIGIPPAWLRNVRRQRPRREPELEGLIAQYEERRRNSRGRRGRRSGLTRRSRSTPRTMNQNRSHRELRQAQQRREVLSAARSFGRLHASLQYLIEVHATPYTVAELVDQQRQFIQRTRYREVYRELNQGNLEFARAREAGLISRTESGSWVSSVPRMSELSELSMRVSWFADEFDAAFEQQFSDHYRAVVTQCLLIIATELLFWGLGRTVSLALVPSRAALPAGGIGALFRAARSRLIGACLRLNGQARSILRGLRRANGKIRVNVHGESVIEVGARQRLGVADTPLAPGSTSARGSAARGRGGNRPSRGRSEDIRATELRSRGGGVNFGRPLSEGVLRIEELSFRQAGELQEALYAAGWRDVEHGLQYNYINEALTWRHLCRYHYGITGPLPRYGFRVYRRAGHEILINVEALQEAGYVLRL